MEKEVKEKVETEKAVDEKVPSITVRAKGRIERILERLAKLYEAKHSGRTVSWVYAPEHKPELSNVMERQMDGYQLVRVEDIGSVEVLFGREPSDLVRVGDVVLMSTTKENKFDLRKENVQAASDQRKQIERSYYDEQQGVRAEGPLGSHSLRPRGSAKVRDAEADLHREQRTGDEEG